jgi:hypothetical protein
MRYYYLIQDDGTIVFAPSWTTVLKHALPTSQYLIEWYAKLGMAAATLERDQKASYGTMMHSLIAKFMIGSLKDLNYDTIVHEVMAEEKKHLSYVLSRIHDLQKALISFAQFYNDKQIQPLAIEVPLYSKKWGIAGATDLVCKMKHDRKNIIALIDFKSGLITETHEYQVHGYKETFEENFPNYKIDKVFCWSPKDWRTKPTYELVDLTDKPAKDLLPHVIEIFKAKGLDKPKDRIEIYGKIKPGMDVSNNFRVISVEELIRKQESYLTGYPILVESFPANIDDAPFVADTNEFEEAIVGNKSNTNSQSLDNFLEF